MNKTATDITKVIDENLIPVNGTISVTNKIYSISIRLQPFQLYNEVIDGILIIENVYLPQERIKDLAHKEFTFPINPDVGYVETSIYVWSVHNPIDVIGIKFGDFINGKIETSFEMTFVFEFEGRCKNLSKMLFVMLKEI